MQKFQFSLVRTSVYGFVSLAFLLAALGTVMAYQYFTLTSSSNPASVPYLTTAIISVRTLRTELRLLGDSDATGSGESEELQTLIARLDNVASNFQNDAATQADLREVRRQLVGLIPLVKPGQQAATRQSIAPVLLILDRILNTAHQELLEKTTLQTRTTRTTVLWICALSFALFLLSLATSIVIRLELNKRQRAEESILGEKQQLALYTDDLGLISAFSELVQAAANQEEVHAAFEQILQKLLPDSAGFVALLGQAGNTAEVCWSWGEGPLYGPFRRHDCLALQLNRVFHRSQSLSHMYCRHIIANRVDSICIPLRGAESPIGVLHLGAPTEIPPERARTVTLLAGHLGFGLANLRLREALKEQSIRDGLTGLFNRRYFDETLQRELANSIRQAKSLCLLMFDIDHFKRLNDQYGHVAGDEALRTLGELMRTSFREGDLLCRYGGEEFAVILIGAELSDAFSKAEELRHWVQKAVVRADFQVIENMTVSVGIAASLEFKTVGKLVRAADTALYQAKHSGRNATWVCSSAAPGLPCIFRAESDVGAERTVVDG